MIFSGETDKKIGMLVDRLIELTELSIKLVQQNSPLVGAKPPKFDHVKKV